MSPNLTEKLDRTSPEAGSRNGIRPMRWISSRFLYIRRSLALAALLTNSSLVLRAINVFTVPELCLAVRPRLCIALMALGTGSYIKTRSADGTSNPSSPTDVATNTFTSPERNSSSLANCSFCVMPFCLPLVA